MAVLCILLMRSILPGSESFADASREDGAYPDIKWEPKPYPFESDPDSRHIDYENGDDRNPGTRDKPWKHHPWDEAATAKAAKCAGIHTYCFKKGTTYRGTLTAKESGQPDNPIRLCADPSYGHGRASLYGSIRISDGWKPCNDIDCPEIPARGRPQTWYVDTDKQLVPSMLWEIHEDQAIRIPIARTPNWKMTDPDDPRSEWWELTGRILEVRIYLDHTDRFAMGDHVTGTSWRDVGEENNQVVRVGKDHIQIEAWNWKKGEIRAGSYVTNGRGRAKVLRISGSHDVISRLADVRHLIQNDPEYYVGTTIWAEREAMPKPDAGKVVGYDPGGHSLRVNYHRGVKGPGKYDRYYLEGLPKFLDSPGEFCHSKSKEGKFPGRLFIRLPGDRNPNSSIIEAGKEAVLVNIKNKSNIMLSGLDLRFSNATDCGTKKARHAALHASAIRIIGECSNIRILNSEISNVPAGIMAFPKKKGDILDHLEVSDNNFHDIDGPAMALSNGRSHYRLKTAGARLIHVNVMRNRAENVGYRVLSHWGPSPHALHVEGGELVEVSGNVIDRSWGAGILVFNGGDHSTGGVERPLMRSLIHHNKVTNSLLGMQDYGGIASWMGGPSYVYCNISGNPVGYRHAHHRKSDRKDWYRNSCYGIGIYLDGQYKGYAFNNVIWGKNNNVNDRIYNACAFNEAMGFMNTVFNNTMYRFGIGIHKGMIQHNRCYYLGNLISGMGHKFIQHEPAEATLEYDSLAYTNNIFHGTPSNFGKLGKKVFPSLSEWQTAVASEEVMTAQTGHLTEKDQVLDAEAHDFRLKPDSISLDKGVKVFVPWGLYSVVGEWHFFHHPADPAVILGENMNWNSEWLVREMYDDIPRNDLKAHNIGSSDFKAGILEDWIRGALKLNGKDQYCDISDRSLKEGYKWSETGCERQPCSGYHEGKDRDSVDMGTNNFLIEVVFQTDKGSGTAGIVCKRARKGYALDITENGYVRLTLNFSGSECSGQSAIPVNDGKWHHVVAEVDRTRPGGIYIYMDGKRSDGQWKGLMNSDESLSNTANFTVGKSLAPQENFFRGMIDFLRISRGTLEDAETTVEELFRWEFDGPFLKDFHGRPVTGKCRDAGALEYQ